MDLVLLNNKIGVDGQVRAGNLTRETSGRTKVTLEMDMKESHYNNHVMAAMGMDKVLRRYNRFNGSGVFGRSFIGYRRHILFPVAVSKQRVLPESPKQVVKKVRNGIDGEGGILVTSFSVGMGMLLMGLLSCCKACYCRSCW